jgi:uncharacterized phage infection (PIP) family protein YhgE
LAQALRSGRDALNDAAATMRNAVKEVNDGIGTYTDKVATLHVELDNNLAAAIDSLNGTVSGLVEGLEEFTEQFAQVKK